MMKVVLKLDILDEKVKQKAMTNVSSLFGVDSVAVDMKDKKLTVIGDVDPVSVVSKLRKICHADIVSVGPAKEQEKKDAAGDKKKEEEKKKAEALKAAYLAYQQQQYYYQQQQQQQQQQQAYYQYNNPPYSYSYQHPQAYYQYNNSPAVTPFPDENPNSCVIC